MKFFCLPFLLLFSTLALKSQDIQTFKNSKGVWGFKDKVGKVLVEPKYYYKPSDFKEGRSVFTVSGLKGVLNDKGEEIVAAQYKSISDFKYGFAVVKNETADTARMVNGKATFFAVYGIIDRSGKEIVPPIYRKLDGDFSNGWFVVATAPNRSGWEKFHYNTEGKIFTPPDGLTLLDYRIDGKKFIALKGSKMGLVDRQFNEILPFEYNAIRPSENDMIILKQNNLYGLMDTKLKWILKPAYKGLQEFKNGFAVVDTGQNLLGAVNMKGVITTKPQFAKIYRIDKTNSAIAMYKNVDSDKSGLVDLATGKIITIAKYYFTPFDYNYGLISFRRENKKGLMDSTGRELFYDLYDDFSPGFSSEGRAWVMKDKKYGFIDRSGKLVVPVQYEMVNGYAEGLAKVKLGGKYGYINAAGDLVIPISFEGADSFEAGIAWVKDDNNKTYYIDKTGKVVK